MFCALCVSCCMTSLAQNNFYQISDKSVKSMSISPNGRYAVGIEYASMVYGNDSEIGLSSYIWDLGNDTKKWITIADIDQLDKSGSFRDVNDLGMIVGYYKDEASTITTNVFGEVSTLPINTAALWYDGKMVNLGLGDDMKAEDCNHFTDGSLATAISNDGRIIGGNYVVRTSSYPCVWKLNDNGEYKYEALSLTAEDGTEATKGSVKDISNDGSVIVGDVYVNKTKSSMPAYWINGKLHVIMPAAEDKDLEGRHQLSGALSVSPNGEYISMMFKKKFLALYSVSEQKYKRAESVEGAKTILAAPVNDNGEVLTTIECGSLMSGKCFQRSMRFCYGDGSLVDLSYVLKVVAPDLDLPFSLEVEDMPSAIVMGYTNDGWILGNNGFSSWALKINNKDFKIPQTPEGLCGRLSGPKQVTLTWPVVKDAGYNIISYNVYRDGELIDNVPAQEDTKEYKHVIDDAEIGYKLYSLSTICDLGNGKTIESPRSNLVEVVVPNSVATSLFEDFEMGSWQNDNYWALVDDVNKDNRDHIWGCLPFKGFISAAGVTGHNMSESPYSLSAISKPVDATNLNSDMYLAFAIRKKMFNSTGSYTKDSLSVDVTTDWGLTWHEVAVYTAQDLPRTYTFESLNLTDNVKGNVFQLRLRWHGTGFCDAQFMLDQLSISEEREYTPNGLIAYNMQDNKRQIRWKNTYDAYELTYMCNPYGDTSGMTIGNEGKEIIAANLYDPEMLAPFQDKYLTAVTTALNWYNEGEISKLDASIMVWEGDELVREQKFPVEIFNSFIVIKLDEPLKINAEKSLKVGIKVENYPATQMPLLYLTTPDYVTTKSDIYSEDGGKTWNTLKDAYADSNHPEDGYAAWKISAAISDEPETEMTVDNSLVAYNIYRDGEKLNGEMIHSLQNAFVEEEAPETGNYEVRGYYLDGGVTKMSEPLSIVPTSIESNEMVSEMVYNPATKTISINGEFDKASVYTVDGMNVAETADSSLSLAGLVEGVYILKVESHNSINTYKLLVK